jgi:hypothetical protein
MKFSTRTKNDMLSRKKLHADGSTPFSKTAAAAMLTKPHRLYLDHYMIGIDAFQYTNHYWHAESKTLHADGVTLFSKMAAAAL